MFGGIIGIIGLACAIWVIYDVFAKNKKLDTKMKIIWTVAAILFSIITAIVYYFIGKK
ncbi:hypothetical protein HN587_02690 [Candidatus Woesearchaeota archaeon]|jgi:hypothetical protein|nr:hypothetical protein [Candidatus Woesearchaeota archaeon]